MKEFCLANPRGGAFQNSRRQQGNSVMPRKCTDFGGASGARVNYISVIEFLKSLNLENRHRFLELRIGHKMFVISEKAQSQTSLGHAVPSKVMLFQKGTNRPRSQELESDEEIETGPFRNPEASVVIM